MLKSCLVAIAKDEDNYIGEWLEYHLKIGFDHIILIRNHWEYVPKVVDDRIEIVDYNSNEWNAQWTAYNMVIQKRHVDFEWMAFWDIDEFLVLKKDRCVNDFLKNYEECTAIGINWRIFGDSNLSYDPNDNSVLKRFTMCGKTLNEHIKTIIHTKKTGCNLRMFIHHVVTPVGRTVDVLKKSIILKEFNWGNHDEIMEVAYLDHFRNKTREECMKKCIRNDNGFDIGMNYVKKFESEFAHLNINEVHDYSARDFLYGQQP